jgi:hypothetical protein
VKEGNETVEWYDIRKRKPKLGETALIFCQGYDITGKHYWSDYHIGTWIKKPYDRRQRVFGDALHVKLAMVYKDESLRDVWVYTDVTHWMPLPQSPEKVRK